MHGKDFFRRPLFWMIVGVLSLVFSQGGYPEAAPQKYDKIANIIYAEIPGFNRKLTSLDLYLPKMAEANPVVVFIHGGAWRMGDKGRQAKKGAAFARQGYIFVSVNYRLSPQVKHPTHVQDVAKAVAWVYKNIEKYKGDPNRIFIMGHSAGGYLAALLATDEQYLKNEGLNLNILKGVILLDGTGFDLAKIKELNARSFRSLYRPAFGDDPQILREASVITHVEGGKGIAPFLIFYTCKNKTFRIQVNLLTDRLNQAGVAFEVIPDLKDTHNSINGNIGEPKDKNTAKIFEFIAREKTKG